MIELMQLPMEKSKLDVLSITRRELNKFVVQKTDGVDKCLLRKNENSTLSLQTSGINMRHLCQFPEQLEVIVVVVVVVIVVVAVVVLEVDTKPNIINIDHI